MPEMIAPASALQRVQTFLAAYRAADNDDDLEVRVGMMEGGEPALLVSINGTHHAFTTAEARRVANIAEEAMNAHPTGDGAEAMPNLILALRMGADKADAGLAHSRPPREAPHE